VLVVRGELLKRYPDGRDLRAGRAWHTANGSIDPTRERALLELSDEEAKNPPATSCSCRYTRPRWSPDIYFFGFDLTVDEARGGTGKEGGDAPGWFFVMSRARG